MLVSSKFLFTGSALHGHGSCNNKQAAVQQARTTYARYRMSNDELLGRAGNPANERTELKNDEKG